MLEEIINNQKIQKYIKPFKPGETVFAEGDSSQDLYLLVSGCLEVVKGNSKLADITEAGAPFGEMSFLLGALRTATVRAASDTTTICIPKKEIAAFLSEFPEEAQQITRLLAARLDETTQVLSGLKQFCNQLPDAVILTDKEGRLISWNTAAENLYGRDLSSICNKSVEEIYEVPGAYKTLLEEVQAKHNLREKILTIKHPQKHTRYVSTSISGLYDGRGNFEGFISLGRDVTEAKTIETKYHKVRSWYMQALIVFGILAAGLLLGLLLFL